MSFRGDHGVDDGMDGGEGEARERIGNMQNIMCRVQSIFSHMGDASEGIIPHFHPGQVADGAG